MHSRQWRGSLSREPYTSNRTASSWNQKQLFSSGLEDSRRVKNYLGGLHQSTKPSTKVTHTHDYTGLPSAAGSAVMWLPVTALSEPLPTPTFKSQDFSALPLSSFQWEVKNWSGFWTSDALRGEKGGVINYQPVSPLKNGDNCSEHRSLVRRTNEASGMKHLGYLSNPEVGGCTLPPATPVPGLLPFSFH